jgi:hypothetical protein
MNNQERLTRAKQTRQWSKVVETYLSCLAENQVHRRRVSRESLERRIKAKEETLALLRTHGVKPSGRRAQMPYVQQLRLMEEIHQLRQRLEAQESGTLSDDADLVAARNAWIEIAKPYSEYFGLSWETWRGMGVPVADLRAAGLLPAGTSTRRRAKSQVIEDEDEFDEDEDEFDEDEDEFDEDEDEFEDDEDEDE